MLLSKSRGLLVGVAMVIPLGCIEQTGNQDDPDTRQVTLRFTAIVGDQEAECGRKYSGLGTTAESAEILDLRFYVSNIRLVNSNDEQVPLTLDQDGKWQVQDVALLDFESGVGKCGDAGTVDRNDKITGTVPQGSYDGIMFDLGVPFEMNHDDLAASPSPLNVSAMFWARSIGRKFLRIDLEREGGLQWSVHLGSTMCDSGGPADPPIAACARVNRPSITLDSFDPDADAVMLDIVQLFADSDLTVDTRDTASGCQSSPDDANECTALFPNLGLDFTTGDCIDGCAQQSAFRIHPAGHSHVDVQAAIARGQALFTTPRETAGGKFLGCASCHRSDGSGDIGPDIRRSTVAHLLEHAQGDGPHPEGVKFAALTEAQFEDIALYLASFCEADPDCMPGSVDEHDHH